MLYKFLFFNKYNLPKKTNKNIIKNKQKTTNKSKQTKIQ